MATSMERYKSDQRRWHAKRKELEATGMSVADAKVAASEWLSATKVKRRAQTNRGRKVLTSI